MSYLTQAQLVDDQDLRRRVTACAASEGVENPEQWAYANRWRLSASPGWVEAYASAIAGGADAPGMHEGAVTDLMILAEVQAVIAVGSSE